MSSNNLMKTMLTLSMASLIGWSGATHAADDDNPFNETTLFVNPDFVKEVSDFFGRNSGYKDKASDLGLLKGDAWDISTAIWLDSKQAIQGYEGKSHSMLYYLQQAAEQAKTAGPVTITFVVYDLPVRDCSAYSSNGEFTRTADIEAYKSDYIGAVTSDTNNKKTSSSAEETPPPTTIAASLEAFYKDTTITNQNQVRIVLIIEPDSLPNMITNSTNTETKCPDVSAAGTYTTGISYALTTFHSINSHIYQYLDIGSSAWLGWTDKFNPATDGAVTVPTLYSETTIPGFEFARGFITNTSNYSPLTEGFTYEAYLDNTDIISTDFYSWNNVYDETSYIGEIMSVDKKGVLTVDEAHKITKPDTPLYADKYFLVDTGRNGWLLNKKDYKNASKNIYSRRDQRHHRGNWCNVQSVKTDEETSVPSTPTSSGLGELPTSTPPVVTNPLYEGNLPIDAYVWIKPPLESDGFYEPKEGKGDQMCGSEDGGSHNGSQSTDSLQNGEEPAPHAGEPFDAAFRNLIDVAVCIKGGTSDFCNSTSSPTKSKK